MVDEFNATAAGTVCMGDKAVGTDVSDRIFGLIRSVIIDNFTVEQTGIAAGRQIDGPLRNVNAAAVIVIRNNVGIRIVVNLQDGIAFGNVKRGIGIALGSQTRKSPLLTYKAALPMLLPSSG